MLLFLTVASYRWIWCEQWCHGYSQGWQGSCSSGFSLPFATGKGIHHTPDGKQKCNPNATSHCWRVSFIIVFQCIPTNHLCFSCPYSKSVYVALNISYSSLPMITELLMTLAFSVVSILCFLFASLCSDSRWKHSAIFGFSWLKS